jgi:hypothetical protein
MRPNAMTPAGKTATAKRPSSNATREEHAGGASRSGAVGHQRKLRPPSAPRGPRRVSGPLTRPERERDRVPGSGRGAGWVRERGKVKITERAAAFLRSLPDHMLVDRLVRGRAWISVLGVMLVGIVAMQVEVLKLGASFGRSMQRTSALTTRNELLRASVASLGDDQRIEKLAAGMGMIMPAPDAVGFLSATRGGDAQQAIANIHAPDATAFLSPHDTNGAVATVSTFSAVTGSIAVTAAPGSSTSGTSSSSGTAASSGTTTSPGLGSATGGSASATSPQSAQSQPAATPTTPTQAPVTQTSTAQTAPTQPAAAQTAPAQGATSPQTGGAGAAALQPAAPTQTQTGGSGGG